MEALNHYEPVPEFSDSIKDWLIALGITVAWFAAMLAIRHVIRAYDARLRKKPDVDFMELLTSTLSRTSVLFMLVLAAEAGLTTLTPSGVIARISRSVVMIALIWQVGLWSRSPCVQ